MTVKECLAEPETYIAFPVAESKVEVWLHMESGIVPTGWSYELFREFLNVQKGAGCNSYSLGDRASYWMSFVEGGKFGE